MNNELKRTAQDEKINTKLILLSEEPIRLYEILEKISDIVKRKDLAALMNLSNYELFLVYFCCNNDSMSLVYEGKYNFFDEPITYNELYKIIDESEEFINSWTMSDYTKIRKLIEFKNSTELIATTQDLGLSPYIVNYDFSQPVLSILNFLFFKEQYLKLQKLNKSPSLMKKESFKLYNKVLNDTLIAIIDRYKAMKKFFKDRKEVSEKRINAIDELIEAIDNDIILSLISIPNNWHQYLNDELLEPLYTLIMNNQKQEYKNACLENEKIKSVYNQTPFIKYLYDNKIDSNSINPIILEKLNKIPYEELMAKINLFTRLSFDLNDILTKHIEYILNTDISIINQFNNYLDKGIIKTTSLMTNISILNSPKIIEINYSILRSIIDVHNIYYDDKLLLLNTLDLKNRLSILAEYNLSINNYMYLLSNIEYLKYYDLILENNIPTYLFISICKTSDPLNTIKKIIICKSIDIEYEQNGKLIKEVKKPNSFMCPNDELDDFLPSVVDYYLPEPINGTCIYDIKDENIIKDIDKHYRKQDTYLIGDTEISRPKVLRNLQSIKNKQLDINKYLLQAIISNSILNEGNITDIKEMISIEKKQKTIS